MQRNKPILIIGGGIGGLCTAISLHKKGIPVKVFERVAELKCIGAGLVLATNAVKALEAIGIREEITAAGREMDQIQLLSQNGNILNGGAVSEFVKSKYQYGSYAIHRADLHRVLISLLPKGIIHTAKACERVEQDHEGVRVFFTDGSMAEGAGLIAADGIHSAVRKQLLPSVSLRYSGYTCWRAILPAHKVPFAPHQASETWGRSGRFGIVPLQGNRIYWFATRNAPEGSELMGSWKSSELQENFSRYHQPISSLLKTTSDSDIYWNDIHDFKPLSQFAFNKIVLSGDAAHATTPNMGQGACMAIEDAAWLGHFIRQNQEIETAFKAFEENRKSRTKWIVETSYRIGEIGQWRNPVLTSIRNGLVKLTPQSVNEKQVNKLFGIHFPA